MLDQPPAALDRDLPPQIQRNLSDPEALAPLRDSGIQLAIGIPNEILPTLANDTVDFSSQWLQSNIFSHVLPSQVLYLVVGNEVLLKQPFYVPFIVPAILNLYGALQALGLSESIKLSSSHASTILSQSYPPSSGAFDPTLKPALLRFLLDTGSPLMINVYPFFSYIENRPYVTLDSALFRSSIFEVDRDLTYRNVSTGRSSAGASTPFLDEAFVRSCRSGRHLDGNLTEGLKSCCCSTSSLCRSTSRWLT